MVDIKAHTNEAYREGYAQGIEDAAFEARGVEPDFLKGKSDVYVSVYCQSRVDAKNAIRALAKQEKEDD